MYIVIELYNIISSVTIYLLHHHPYLILHFEMLSILVAATFLVKILFKLLLLCTHTGTVVKRTNSIVYTDTGSRCAYYSLTRAL